MYSPKISEELIPDLYRMAKARKTPMTKLVNVLLTQALKEATDATNGIAAGLLEAGQARDNNR